MTSSYTYCEADLALRGDMTFLKSLSKFSAFPVGIIATWSRDLRTSAVILCFTCDYFLIVVSEILISVLTNSALIEAF
jgi:hypothetical protein